MDRLDKAIKIYKQISNSCDDAKEECKTCKRNKECDFYCDFASPMDVSFYLSQIGDLFLKEPSIQLKNIDTSMNFCELRNKLIEDREKFDDAIVDCMFSYACEEKSAKEYEKHAIEELWDMIQTGLELINKTGITADEVMEGYNEYLEKIKK